MTGQIVGHGTIVQIIGLRAVCVIVRNADALNPVQRIDLRRKKNFRNGFHFAKLLRPADHRLPGANLTRSRCAVKEKSYWGGRVDTGGSRLHVATGQSSGGARRQTLRSKRPLCPGWEPVRSAGNNPAACRIHSRNLAFLFARRPRCCPPCRCPARASCWSIPATCYKSRSTCQTPPTLRLQPL